MADAAEHDWQAYQAVLALWQQENPIKTTKLQVLLAVNGGLLGILQLVGGFVRSNAPIFVAGAVLSTIWLFSIGRSVYYQELWYRKLELLRRAHPDDIRFAVHDTRDVAAGRKHGMLAILGSVKSRYYLLGAPMLFAITWMVVIGWVMGSR